MNVLLLHVKKNLLPDRIRNSPEIGHLTVLTEPGHAQSYGDDVDVRLLDDVQNVEELRRAVLQVLRERRIDRIFSPFELGQAQAGYLRTHFGFPGMGAEVAHAFASKYRMKQVMREAGLPVADFALAFGLDQVPRAAAELGWPVVVKPMIGGGSLDVCVLDDAAVFERFLRSPAADALRSLTVPLVVESFVAMTAEYHCDGVVHDGRVVFAIASRYLVPVLNHGARFGSTVLPAGDAVRGEIERMHERAVGALGLAAGVTHMEFFDTAGGLVAGEIACRPAGGGIPDAVNLQSGVDVWQACLQTSLGVEPKVAVVPEAGVIAHCYLPLSPGRITAMSSPEELAALPGVLRVDQVRRVGDIVPRRLNSASSSVLVYLRAASPDEVPALVDRVYDTFRIEIQGVDE